jgi:hypothetical protein
MVLKTNPNKWEAEFEKGSSLSKCQKCGCMIGALEEMKAVLSSASDNESVKLMKKFESWLGRMKPSLYT